MFPVGQERVNSRSKCQSIEKRKRKSDIVSTASVEVPASRSVSPSKRLKSGEPGAIETERELDGVVDSTTGSNNCLQTVEGRAQQHQPSPVTASGKESTNVSTITTSEPSGLCASREKTTRLQKQKCASKGGKVCSGDADFTAPNAKCGHNKADVPLESDGQTDVLGTFQRDETKEKELHNKSVTNSVASVAPAGRKETSSKRGSQSRKVADRERKEGKAATRHGVCREEHASDNSLTCRESNEPKHCVSQAEKGSVVIDRKTHRPKQLTCQTVRVAEDLDDNMHFKKQLLLAGGNSSPSSSCAATSQSDSLSVSIDVNRSVTDQLTKLAKSEKLSLGGDGKSGTDNTSITEAAVTPINTSSSLSVDKAEKNESKVHDFMSDRHREASAFTCVQSNALRSYTGTPSSEDRSDSRASDIVVLGVVDDSRRPGSRVDDLRSVKSSPTSSPLIVDRSEPVNIYRDPELMSKNTVRSSLNSASLHKTMSGATYPSVPAPVPTPPSGLPTSSPLPTHPSSISRSLIPGLTYAHQLSHGAISHGLSLQHGYSQLDPLAARGLVAAQQQQIAALQQYQNTAHLMQIPYSSLTSGAHRLPQLEVLQKFPQAPVPPTWLLAAKQSETLQREQLERIEQEQRVERERLERLERDRLERAERERRERKEKVER